MNRFLQAHQTTGNLSPRQLIALDRFLCTMGRRRFNVYRCDVGIEPGTPNRLLSGREAWRLTNRIISDIEVSK